MFPWRGLVCGVVGLILLTGSRPVEAAPAKLWVTVVPRAAVVRAGSQQIVTVASQTGARCAVAVAYANGVTDTQAALQVVKTVGHGPLVWVWKVSAHAAAGTGSIGAGCWLDKQTVTVHRSITIR